MKELIKLWDKYLEETVAERTHEWLNEDNTKTLREWKGDMDGFMRWLKLEENKIKIIPPICSMCNKPMKPVYDKIAKKITGYLWQCKKCAPKLFLSIG